MTLAGLAACVAAGCATYTDHIRDASLSTAAGNYEGGLSDLNKVLGVQSTDELPDDWSGDRPLAALDRGTLQQALTRYPASARDLSGAEQVLELLDMKTDPVGTLGAYIYSDSVKTYRTPPSERLALNALNLLNYLAVGDLNGAAVEARRFQVMRDYLDSESIKADQPARLGTFLAGFVFERRGEADRALRYYEETLALGPLPALDPAIVRLTRTNPYRGPHIKEILARNAANKADPVPPCELLIVLSLGRVPHKEPKRIPVGVAVGLAGTFASGDVDWLKYGAGKVVVYPELVATPSALGEPEVSVDGGPVRIEPLVDLGATVRQEYEEAKPKIIAAALTRMAARGGAAEGIRAAGKQQSSLLGDILAILFESTMVALDRPDTRSWTMLPNQVLVVRLPVSPGQHGVEVKFPGGGARNVTADVPKAGYAVAVVTEPR
ncbi:MAG TPA: hypothetical protein VMW17_07605 [Candidatus Binatia bacterium]|nr:hypothetical protein [Candidatus Binatia bacterium]